MTPFTPPLTAAIRLSASHVETKQATPGDAKNEADSPKLLFLATRQENGLIFGLQSVFVTHKPSISLHHYQPLSLLEKKKQRLLGAHYHLPFFAPALVEGTDRHQMEEKDGRFVRTCGQRIHTSRPSRFLLSLRFSHRAPWSVCPPPLSFFTVFVCTSCIKYSRRARQLVQMKALL